MRYLTYLIYIILYEGFTLGGGVYMFGFEHRSVLWLILGLILSAGAYSPVKWAEICQSIEKKEGKC